LSTAEPSLVGFAFDLITLGLDGVALFKAFSEISALRKLVRAGEDAKNGERVKQIVDELNKLGDAKGDGDLGKNVLRDLRSTEHDASATAHTLHPPPGSDYLTADELRTAVRAHIRNALEYTADNESWTEFWTHLANNRHTIDPDIAAMMRKVHKLIRDPQLIEDAMVELWIAAAREQITPQQALMRFFGGESGMPVLIGQTDQAFEEAMLANKPAIDDFFGDTVHGAYTHMFQEYVLARALGGREAAMNVRHMIARLNGPMSGPKTLAGLAWDALFDEYMGHQINSPEGLGSILAIHLNFPIF
jgi:hypothetical protein